MGRPAAGRRPAKAAVADDCECFEQIPNIGPACAADLRLLGLEHPRDLAREDPWALYQRLCRQTQQRQDPCVLDTLLAAVDFMQGAAARPWWHYTALRKTRWPDL